FKLAEKVFQQQLAQTKECYESGVLKPQNALEKYSELLEVYAVNAERREEILLSRAEFNIYMSSKAVSSKQKELMLESAKKDYEAIIKANAFHQNAGAGLEKMEQLLKQINSPTASLSSDKSS